MTTLEDRLKEWEKQPGARVSPAEREFIPHIRAAAANGVGYGWMQQVIEWEWQARHGHAWGPEYFERQIRELEAKLAARPEGVTREAIIEECADLCDQNLDQFSGTECTYRCDVAQAIRALKRSPMNEGGK